jgi:hypothetical protein
MKKIRPKCMPVQPDGSPHDRVENMPNFTSVGWMLPCCWLDHTPIKNENYGGLFDPELNIQNIDNVQDIFRSPQWRQFFYNLINDQAKCHNICWKNCGIETQESIDNLS